MTTSRKPAQSGQAKAGKIVPIRTKERGKSTPRQSKKPTADALAESFNVTTGPAALIAPMEGFSHQDRAGGLIEDPALRQVFLDRVLKSLRQDIAVTALDSHISVSETT